jgi:septum formation protein
MPEQPKCPIILASASPRRRQLLAEAGYKFTVVPPDIDESAFLTEAIDPCEYAKRLALAKAKSVAQKHPASLAKDGTSRQDCIVIGADTVVDFNGQIIGKPNDAKEAKEITRKLFSAPHKVITAVAIVRLNDGTEIVESDSTTIYPKKITDKQIAEHIKSGSWQNKAGAYAIKETDDEFIERIEGSLTNVMGLPMELLSRLLPVTA